MGVVPPLSYDFVLPLRTKRFRSTFALLILLIPGLVACSSVPASPGLIPVTLQLPWLHQAQFAGLYAADQEGYFAEEGLEVSFIEGGPEVDFLGPVLEGSAHFGIAQPADIILARAAGQPVQGIAAIYRRSPVVFVALAETGITSPYDFIGKKIRTAVTIDQTLRAMMMNVGISSDQYETVNLPSDIELFKSGEVPVWGGYVNVFALELQRAGYEINFIYPDDYRIHFYGDVLITTDDLIEKQPDLVLRFTRAALRGWTYAVENPETTGAFVQKYNPEADPDLETARMISSIPLVNTGEDYIGWMNAETWQAMEQTLLDQILLPETLDIEQVYTMQFLEEVYGQ